MTLGALTVIAVILVLHAVLLRQHQRRLMALEDREDQPTPGCAHIDVRNEGTFGAPIWICQGCRCEVDR